MPRRQRSPIRVGACKPWPFPAKKGEKRRLLCRWVCDDTRTPAAAEFVHRKSGKTAILHPSTKKSGFWQLSFFDGESPSGDMMGTSCNAVLWAGSITPSAWKLRSVAPIER